MNANCPECGQTLPSRVSCNIHGTFCSDQCLETATERGYPKHIENSLETIKQCFEQARLAHNASWWQEKWEAALADVTAYIKRDR